MSKALQKVDWDLLHKQKASLLRLQSRTPMNCPEWEALEGMVCLLDALQDEAVEAGRWSSPQTIDVEEDPQADNRAKWPEHKAHLIYEAYPEQDVLPIKPPALDEPISKFAYRAEEAGDTLFLFLCREANDEATLAEYLARLNRAIREIEEVRDYLIAGA